jgi:hypothetical protein
MRRFALRPTTNNNKEEQAMDEKIMVESTRAEFDEILRYQETLDGATVQTAILNAINIALDKED